MVGPWRGSVARATPFGLSRDEYVQTLAKRISYSRAYTAFYISVIAAALLEVGWIVFPGGAASSDGSASAAAPLSRPAGHLPSSRLFSAVESYVTLGLLAELGVRAAMQQRGFWSHRANWLDIGVAAVSLLTSLLLMLGLETPSEVRSRLYAHAAARASARLRPRLRPCPARARASARGHAPIGPLSHNRAHPPAAAPALL